MNNNERKIKLAYLGPMALGYICPTCGMPHCKYEQCLRCGQPLAYNSDESDYVRRFKNVDEECRIRDAEQAKEIDIFTSKERETLTEFRKRIKIEM